MPVVPSLEKLTMNPTIAKALAFLESEEQRLLQVSGDADQRARDAREAADAAEEEWRAAKSAAKALREYTSNRSEVQS